jgi:hypothetical protein
VNEHLVQATKFITIKLPVIYDSFLYMSYEIVPKNMVLELNAWCGKQKTAATQNLKDCVRAAINHHQQQLIFGVVSNTVCVTNL